MFFSSSHEIQLHPGVHQADLCSSDPQASCFPKKYRQICFETFSKKMQTNSRRLTKQFFNFETLDQKVLDTITQAWIKFSDKNIEDSNSARQGKIHTSVGSFWQHQKSTKTFLNQGEIWRLTWSSVRIAQLRLH